MQSSFQINELYITNNHNMTINARITGLRAQLKKYHINALIVSTSDPHQSEYIANHWKGREWLSGFDGSAGTAVITADHAGLWTDSRYFLQAEQQLSLSEFKLHKITSRLAPGYLDWLCNSLQEGDTVAIDGRTYSKSQEKSIRSKLNKFNIKLVTHLDLISEVWIDQPLLPTTKVFLLDEKFSGVSAKHKIKEIRKHMFVKKGKYMLLSALDEIAWTLNIRGNDIEFNPVSMCFFLIGAEKGFLYIDDLKIIDLKEYFNDLGIIIRPYESLSEDLKNLKETILIDATICNAFHYDCIDSKLIISDTSIVNVLKAEKNKTELENFRTSMIKDGVALSKAFHWLEKNIDTGVSEFDFGEKLTSFRAEQKNYFGTSFPPIVGFEGNGAIIHYRAEKESAKVMNSNGWLLCDSGAQFFEGTTDITRTFSFGEPTDEQKKTYTLVLLGHIDLAMAEFPEGTKGVQLDLLARQHLWKAGLNYSHGTGHGVGHFLNVHEGPQGFDSGNSVRGRAEIKEGMVTSNEPGYYKENEFGIRIENLVVCVKAETSNFLKFETITLFPIDTRPIDKSLMNNEQIKWLNDYHSLVWDKLSPHLDEELHIWLKPQCLPI